MPSRAEASRSTAGPTCPGSSRSAWPGRATTASTSSATTSGWCRRRGPTARRASRSSWAAAWAPATPGRTTLPPPGRPLGWVPADRVEELAEAIDPRLPRPRRTARTASGPGSSTCSRSSASTRFRREVEAALRALRWPPRRSCPAWHQHDHLGWHRQDDGRWFLGVPVPSGRVAGGCPRRAAEVVERLPGSTCGITPRQDVLLTGIEAADRAGRRARPSTDHGVRAGRRSDPRPPLGHGLPRPPHLRAGPGRGRAGRARGASTRIEARAGPLAASAELDLHVRMTGCPNGCARPYTAEIGIVGRTKTGYDLHLGGAAAGDRLAPLVAQEREAGRPAGRAGAVARPFVGRAHRRRVLRRLRPPGRGRREPSCAPAARRRSTAPAAAGAGGRPCASPTPIWLACAERARARARRPTSCPGPGRDVRAAAWPSRHR